MSYESIRRALQASAGADKLATSRKSLLRPDKPSPGILERLKHDVAMAGTSEGRAAFMQAFENTPMPMSPGGFITGKDIFGLQGSNMLKNLEGKLPQGYLAKPFFPPNVQRYRSGLLREPQEAKEGVTGISKMLRGKESDTIKEMKRSQLIKPVNNITNRLAANPLRDKPGAVDKLTNLLFKTVSPSVKWTPFRTVGGEQQYFTNDKRVVLRQLASDKWSIFDYRTNTSHSFDTLRDALLEVEKRAGIK